MNLSWLSLADANTQWVLASTMLLGLSSGVLGAFALLRRRSLMGDMLAHAALPGVCIAYLVSGSKHIGFFLLGAAVAGILGTLSHTAITRFSKLKEDSAMALVLTVFFGFGLMLLAVIQRSPRGNQSGLDKFLFGQAASMVSSDVQVMATVALLLCLVVGFFFKEFKLLTFDSGFAAGLGFPVGLLDLLLNSLLVLAVVVGLQAVGVVMMAAMLITPPIAARYWTDRLGTMVILSGVFGAFSGAIGTLVSQMGTRMPTGPLIVLAASVIFFVSLMVAPRRGLVARLVRLLQTKSQIERENTLRALYELAEEVGSVQTAFGVEDLKRRKGLTMRGLRSALSGLRSDGLIQGGPDRWRLTAEGIQVAYVLVREQRMWEVFLMHEGELGGYHVDRNGGGYPPPLRGEVERLLKIHGLEPRIRPSDLLEEGA